MKNYSILYFLTVILFACNGKSGSQSKSAEPSDSAQIIKIQNVIDTTVNGVTFNVSSVKPADSLLKTYPVKDMMELKIEKKISFLPDEHKNERLIYTRDNGFIETLQYCYDEHRPLKLSPDHIWTLICQATSIHINQHYDSLKNIIFTDEKKEECPEKKKENRKNISAVKENVSAWERVLKSREKERPVGKDYIDRLFTDFVELHGDRYYKDDPAVVGGIAYFHGKAVTVIAQCKGKTTKENLERNFAMPSPEGYRKALRLMKQAEKFQRPVICFVDTPGAFCGMEAEERGQGEAIARNLYEMSALKVPVLSIVIGEGGSGGALALAVADEVWMMENAVYSVLSPEGFASILWKDSKRASEAAGVMRLTAADLKELKVIEEIICEPEVYREDTMVPVLCELEEKMEHFLEQYGSLSEKQLTDRRYDRFRRM